MVVKYTHRCYTQKRIKWGHISREEYIDEFNNVQRQLTTTDTVSNRPEILKRLAHFLANVADAWENATQEQRNKLAHSIFLEIWLKDKQVVAVKPLPELEPFFKLNYEEFASGILKWRPRGDLNP
ncbi:MAG: hypothetical protein NTX46_02195 [Chloroflexi bacterium]|nr:hypothetical protein [Chloroflexota bacterium]